MKKFILFFTALMVMFTATAQETESESPNSTDPDKIALNNAIILGYLDQLLLLQYYRLYDMTDLSFEDFDYSIVVKSVPFAYKFGVLVKEGRINYDFPLEYDARKDMYFAGSIALKSQDVKKLYVGNRKDYYYDLVYKYEQNGTVSQYDRRGDFEGKYSARFDTQGRIVRLDGTIDARTNNIVVTYDDSGCINMLDQHITISRFDGRIERKQRKYVKTGKDTWSYIYSENSKTEKHTFEIQERDEKGRWIKGVIKYDVDSEHKGVAQQQLFRCIDPQKNFFANMHSYSIIELNSRNTRLWRVD